MDILEIFYDRVSNTYDVILTQENCADYGYLWTEIEIDDEDSEEENATKTIVVYYLDGESEEDYIYYDSDGNTTIEWNEYERHTHTAPPMSDYSYSYDDVDKEGSGRNELTGEMFRERIGNYMKIDVKWAVVPNSVEFHNWYKVLTHLPDNIYANILTPSGEIEVKRLYRQTVTTGLYWYLRDGKQMWTNLATTFTQWDVEEYDDTYEPILESVV